MAGGKSSQKVFLPRWWLDSNPKKIRGIIKTPTFWTDEVEQARALIYINDAHVRNHGDISREENDGKVASQILTMLKLRAEIKKQLELRKKL